MSVPARRPFVDAFITALDMLFRKMRMLQPFPVLLELLDALLRPGIIFLDLRFIDLTTRCQELTNHRLPFGILILIHVF